MTKIICLSVWQSLKLLELRLTQIILQSGYYDLTKTWCMLTSIKDGGKRKWNNWNRDIFVFSVRREENYWVSTLAYPNLLGTKRLCCCCCCCFLFFWSIVCINFAYFNKSLKHLTSESTMFIVLDLFIKIMMSHVVMYLKIGKVGCLWCIILCYIGRTWSFWINKAYYETLIICGSRLLQGYKIIHKQAILFCQYSTLSLLWIGLYIISWFPCLKSSRAYVTQEI